MREIGTVAELDELLLASDDSKKYIIGAGRTGKLLGEYFNFRHIHWEGFFDRNTDKQDLCGMRRLEDGIKIMAEWALNNMEQ